MVKTSTVVPSTSKRSSKKIIAAGWPTKAKWDQSQRVREVMRFRRLGIQPEQIGGNGLPASQTLEVLGRDSFAEFSAVRAAGKVIWVNFELARQLGFDVPRINRLTPEFHNQLLFLSLRAMNSGEAEREQQTITMYADRYGGDGLGPALGAGRAGFLPQGNLYVKGVGFTPLFRHNDPDDFAHSHGGVHLDDCLVEAVFGEVNENLFARGSSRIVAIIDQGKEVIDPAGKRIPIAIVVRTGAQLRPAHLLRRLRSKDAQLEKFVAITTASGQLATKQDAATGETLPDLRATMLRIIDDHAQTAAESFRWRMIHGALSASNMEISGAMLDVPTQSTQPRTAPVWLLAYSDSIFGSEQTARAVHLAPIYRKLLRNVPKSQWKKLNLEWLNIRGEMAQAYGKHVQVQLLSATGLKIEVARRIQAEHSDLARRFADLIIEMSSLKNRGALCVAKSVVEHAAVLDVFNLLRTIPGSYFADPTADHRAEIHDQLKPIARGNRFQVAKKQTTIDGLSDRFAELYRQLMRVCREYATAYYGGLKNMQASSSARASFENEPLDQLYYHTLFREIRASIASYKSTSDVAVIRKAIDERIMASLRRVDALFEQGNCRRLIGGGVELEMRTIDGIDYAVRAWNDKKQTRLLHVGIPAELDDDHYLTSLPRLPRLSKREIESLRYRFTTDRWQTWGEASARLLHDKHYGLIICFALPCKFYLIARLEGAFYLAPGSPPRVRDRARDTGGYVFAIPDKQELNRFVTGTHE